MLLPVIMAGGAGTRLWPLSRQQLPKQFLPLSPQASMSQQSTLQKTMLQQTIQRLDGLETHPPMVVCHEDHRFIVAEQLQQCGRLDDSHIILEALSKSTSASIALAAFSALEKGGDPTLAVLSADHYLDGMAGFHKSLQHAEALAEQGYLVALGVKPGYAETGYGYMHIGKGIANGFKVETFKEKPDLATATAYLASGDYWWNTGIFIFKASRYLEELERFQPEIFAACAQAHNDTTKDMDFLRPSATALAQCPSVSVDYAVMELTQHAAAVLLDSAWSDVGSWEALWKLGKKDHANNVQNGDVVLLNSKNSYVSSSGPLVATLGIDNLVVVATDDAVLVSSRDHLQDVKSLINALHQAGRSELVKPSHVYRPWGYYRVLNTGERFQVKQITVKPGKSLSLQRHHHRSEHWVVVSGTAEVTLEEETFFISENESTYIPLAKVHRLKNPGIIDLELIETQSGSYLGEDDIERLSDDYGRS